MKRIFSVRVNVDEIAASVGVLFTEQEKALWLQGFVYALQGGAPRAGMHPAFDGGFLIGRTAWEAARNHQEVSSKGGRTSIERHPENSVNKRPPSEAPSEGGREQSLIVNRVISNPENESSNNRQDDDQNIFSQALQIMKADQAKPPLAFLPPKSFSDWRGMHPRAFIGKEREDWEALFRLYDYDALADMHATLKAPRIFYNNAAEWLSKNYTP